MSDTNTDTMLVVSEVFGPTVQGEGPSAGHRAGFIRLGRCNLNCGKSKGATWACDTPYTWDWENFDPSAELHKAAPADICKAISDMDVPLVVITGGEPLVQQRRLVPLLSELNEAGIYIEVETNGTQVPSAEVLELVDSFNVSPKLANSGVLFELRHKPKALQALRDSNKAEFKFVVAEPRDLMEVLGIVDEFNIYNDNVWLMPAGTDAQTLMERGNWLADEACALGFNYTNRLHVLTWGNERGR